MPFPAQDDTWAHINHHRGKPHSRRLTTSRSSSTVSTSRFQHQSTTPTATAKPEWLTTQMIPPPPRNSSDSEMSNLVPSYMDILSNTLDHDWLDTYDYPHPHQNTTPTSTLHQQKEEASSRSTNRRTFHHPTPTAEKEPITVRKTKSMRDHTPRTRLRSPPPPPHPDIFHDQPRLPEKKQSMQFMNKVKRKLSFSKDKKTLPQPSSHNEGLRLPALTREPRRTVSSSILPPQQEPLPKLPQPTTPNTNTNTNINNGLSEYQGYSRHSRHRSFTYSPPPPRTSSLNASDVPAVPPIPAVPKLQQTLKSRANSVVVKKKKSGDSTISGGGGGGGSSDVSRADSNSSSSSSSSRPTTSNHSRAQPTANTESTCSIEEQGMQLTPATSMYAMNLSHDLAEIEKDIKELEIQRDRHSSFIHANELKARQHESSTTDPSPQQEPFTLAHSASQHNMATTKTIGRKRGKTLPGSLATPPPIPTMPLLPPLTLNPIQMTIPSNLQRKTSAAAQPRQSTSTTPSSSCSTHSNKIKLAHLSSLDDFSPAAANKKHPLSDNNHAKPPLPGLNLGSGGLGYDMKRLERKSSLSSVMPKRKSHIPTSSTSRDVSLATASSSMSSSAAMNTKIRRAASYRQPTTTSQQQVPVQAVPAKVSLSQQLLLQQQQQQQQQQQYQQQYQQQHHHRHHHQHHRSNSKSTPTPPPAAAAACANSPSPGVVVEGARSPKSLSTALKYYGQYLSDYEKQIEIHDYSEIYFVGPHAQTKKHRAGEHNFGFDDERGDYKIVMQDHLAYRYQVMDVLGRGSFGQVVKCFDHKTAQMVAIKLIRNKKRFHAQAMTEVSILKQLLAWDPHDQCHTIQMTDHFYFRNHLCIAFECLSMNLYEFIKSNHFQGFSLSLIKRMASQILQSLAMLAQHNVIHCDLKPENIMLKHPAKSAIKVIDFGSSCLESERVYTYIQSRFYRSPEVILGMSYHKAIDMWSVGCIIAELYTGLPLFPGENEQEQLSCIMETMGLPDRHLVERCSRKKLFFDSIGNPRIVANSKGKKRYPGTRSLFQALKCHDVVFIDFVERCLQWDPSRRMTPQQGLQHEWITNMSTTHTSKPVSFLSSSALSNKRG